MRFDTKPRLFGWMETLYLWGLAQLTILQSGEKIVKGIQDQMVKLMKLLDEMRNFNQHVDLKSYLN